MIRMCDSDGDGQVSLEEFSRMIFKFAGAPAVLPDEIKALEGDDARDTMPGAQRLLPPAGAGAADQGVLALTDGTAKKPMPTAEEDPVKRRATLKRCVESLRITQEVTKRFFVASESADKDYLTFQDFCTGFTLRPDGTAQQLFDLFDYRKTNQIEFRDICFAILCLLSKSKEEKIKFAFMVYDFDQDGFINQKELSRLLKSSYVAARDDQVVTKAGAILRQADSNKDNNLSFEEISAIDKRYPNLLFPAFQTI